MTFQRTSTLSRAAARPLQALVGGALLACAAAVALQPAVAQTSAPLPQAGQHQQHSHHHKHHRQAGERGEAGMFGASPRHMDRMLDAVNATEAQRTQIRSIVTAAAPAMKASIERGRVLREQARRVLVAPVIDANAAEQVRLQMVAHHDAVSRQRLGVMLDVAQQLTPEQRAKMGELMAQRKARMQQRQERHHRSAVEPAAPNA